MLRFLLIGIFALYAVWALRRFWRGFLFGRQKRGGSSAGNASKPLDLVRDEKTGEFRVKDE